MRLCLVAWVAQGLLAKAFLAQKPGSAHRLRTQLETLKTYKGGKMRDYSSHIRHSGSSPGDRGKRGRLAFGKASQLSACLYGALRAYAYAKNAFKKVLKCNVLHALMCTRETAKRRAPGFVGLLM